MTVHDPNTGEALSDDEVDSALMLAYLGYDPKDKYPGWSNAAMREAYRAGWEDGRNDHA